MSTFCGSGCRSANVLSRGVRCRRQRTLLSVRNRVMVSDPDANLRLSGQRLTLARVRAAARAETPPTPTTPRGFIYDTHHTHAGQPTS